MWRDVLCLAPIYIKKLRFCASYVTELVLIFNNKIEIYKLLTEFLHLKLRFQLSQAAKIEKKKTQSQVTYFRLKPNDEHKNISK